MSALADRFVQSLKQLERDRDLDAIVQLFSDDAELSRAPRRARYQGKDGARTFWSEYLDAFRSIETRFGKVSETGDSVVLEWHSVATTKQGHQIEYDGCSIVEGRDETVRGFRTYYDAASAGMGGAPTKASSADR